VPALSTRTPDRRNRLTLPPRQIAKSGRLSKKLVNHRMISQKTASARIITSRYARRKNTVKMQRRKMIQVSEVSKTASFTPKPETKARLQ
jgi:phosphohistidine phosphatase SixA